VHAKASFSTGIWVLAGILSFTVLEMAMPDKDSDEADEQPQKSSNNNNNTTTKLQGKNNGVIVEDEKNGNYIHSMAVLSEKHHTKVNNHTNNVHTKGKEKKVSGNSFNSVFYQIKWQN
jgi:predicted double-glycine peptidase